MTKKKKIIILSVIITLILIIGTIIYSVLADKKSVNTEADELNASLSIGIPPTVFVSNKDLNLVQNMGTEVNFEGKFKTYGNKDYYYKWMIYKNGIKQTESVCEKVVNNYVDKRTIIIDSGLNLGKWVIYSNSDCTNQSMVYFTLTYSGKGLSLPDKTLTATFRKGSAASIGSTSESCKTNFLTCSIIAPSITAPSGYEVEGWSENITGTSSIYKPGNVILISENKTYYPVLRKIDSNSSKTYTVTLNKNNAQSIGKTSVSCSTVTNDCSVLLPSITAPSGYEVVGWSSNKNANSADYYVNTYINISSNKTLYAIVRKITSSNKEIVVTLNKNGAQSIGKTKVSCETSGSSCNVTLPNITAKSGYEVVGWAENPESSNATYKANQTITVTQNKTLYAITKKKPSITMTRYANTWSTASAGRLLNIKVSPITDSYIVKTSNEDVMTVFNDVLYPVNPGTATVTATSSSGASISYKYTVTGESRISDTSKLKKGILQSYTYGNTHVYVEKGCPTTFANTLKNDVKETPDALRDATRAIYAMTKSSYDSVSVKGSVGVTYVNGVTNVIHINCDYKSNDVYGHELGHAVDYRYAKLSGRANFSSNSDLVSLYNKYNNSGNKNLRTDKFSNSREFFADIFNYNFRTNIAKTTRKEKSEYKGLTYPSDIANLIKRYINEYNALAN